MSDEQYTVLVVDADADVRLAMRAALRKAGYDVRLADSGEEALRRFHEQACDLVMLDVDMPGLSGREVCAMLRVEAGPLLPIVMVTGMNDVKSVEESYQFGATDFISKPVNWALIGHRVRYLLRGYQALLDLRAAQERNAAILSAIPDLLFEVDLDGRYLDYRAPPHDLMAVPPEHFLGKTIAEVLPRAASEVCMAALRTAYEDGSSSGQQFELPLGRGRSWFELSVARKRTASAAKPRFIVLARDISERKQAEARIARLAYFDSLTGLPNRRSFLERIDREIKRPRRPNRKMAVLFMDLDGFKNVNDTMGHATGDLILQLTAERMRKELRPSDLLSRPTSVDASLEPQVEIARLGGDEFTALILDIERPEDAVTVANRISALMRQPYTLEGGNVTLSTSIGIALHPDDGRDGATLLKRADAAMYEAKRSGRDQAQLYNVSLTSAIVQRMEFDASLRHAIDRDELRLVYQPQIDVTSGRITGIEALLRWRHPVRGLVSPLEFIPRAEDSGLIDRIGQWVLATACAEAARWQRAGRAITVSVNLSPLEIAKPDLPQLVVGALAHSGLDPALLEIEITEGALMANSVTAKVALDTLRAHGVHISLDDFGTGHSSLAYLLRMPIDNIKIDRSFVTGLLDGGYSEAIVRAVLAMAASLDMRVTAEGVETSEQALALQAMGCTSQQGHYFSRPVPGDDIAALLGQHWILDPAAPAHRNQADAAAQLSGTA